MRGEDYRRPLLCRLCECPVVDGGVQLGQHHLDKLSRWWKAHWDTDFEDESCIICHFCVCDLRFADEHSKVKEPEGQTWWTNCDSAQQKYYNYYSDEWMKSCSVKITRLANEKQLVAEYGQGGFEERQQRSQNLGNKKPVQFDQCNLLQTAESAKKYSKHQTKKKALKCFFCEIVCSPGNHRHHLFKHHKNQLIRCPNVHCKVIFKTLEEKDKHYKDVHNSGSYFCCFCDSYFKTSADQWSHIKCHHKEALKCNAARKCPNYFKTDEDRQKHIQEEHNAKKYKCTYCIATYNLRGSLTEHIKQFHKDVSLKCEYSHNCSTWFKTEEERQIHYEEKHEKGDKMTRCPACSKQIYIQSIYNHFKAHHPTEQFIKCNYFKCANYFKSEVDKLKHAKEVHENHDEQFRCLYCPKFILKNMFSHIYYCHKEVAIKCNFNDKCPNYFKTLQDRDKHVREVHQTEKIRKPVKCIYCDQILSGRNTLNLHINSKHPETTIKCQYLRCGAFFKSQEDLENHLSLNPKHSKISIQEKVSEILFQCSFCPKSYRSKMGLCI